jgi:hypothetical protein
LNSSFAYSELLLDVGDEHEKSLLRKNEIDGGDALVAV